MIGLAEIFRRHAGAYQEKYGSRMLPSHWRAMQDIQQCRSEALGGHIYRCPNCGCVMRWMQPIHPRGRPPACHGLP